MSILALSPQDNRLFSAEIAAALEDINAAVIVQQLHYWMGKEGVGTVIKGVKYVYNSFPEWVKQFPWLSVWKFRKAMAKLRSLKIVKVIRYKSRQWNQTNYYSLDYARLLEFIRRKSAESIEMVEVWDTTDQEVNSQQIEVRDTNLSYNETKSTVQKETAKAEESEKLKSVQRSENPIAAAPLEKNLEEEKHQEREIPPQQELNCLAGENKLKSGNTQQAATKESNSAKCSINENKKPKIVKLARALGEDTSPSSLVNPNWKSRIEELDSIGVPINKTLINLVKMYEEEEVRSAIALLKIRKREKHIPNLAGYFTAALKEGWSSSNVVENSDSNAVDKSSVFRLWYDLAKQLGYCSGQEMRDGEQWICLSGQWETWEGACDRGYSLEYLKGVMKRNRGQ